MLGRVALPLLRPRAKFPPAVRLSAITYQTQIRTYARDRRSKLTNDYKLPNTAPKEPSWKQSTRMQEPQEELQERFSEDKESSAPEYSDIQRELETPADGRKNFPTSSQELPPTIRLSELNESVSSRVKPSQDDAETEYNTQAQQNTAWNTTSRPYEAPQGEEAMESLKQEAVTEARPQQPLPDLTQGIPSTLDAELREAQSRARASTASLNITEDPSEPAPSSGGRGGEGLPRTAYISSNERKKNNIIKWTYFSLFAGVVGYSVYLGRNWDSAEEEIRHPQAPSGWGIGLYWNRVKARLASTLDYYNEPAFPRLLPKHDPNMQPPMTLVLSLEDLLIHQEWTRERGWRIAKRPGVDYFLRYLSQYYELVLFTTQPSSMADQVIRKLDPYRIISWPLFREATLYKDGGYIKVSQRTRTPNQQLTLST